MSDNPVLTKRASAPENSFVANKNGKPRMLFRKTLGAAPVCLPHGSNSYFGITSRANLLITTSRISLRFFAASSMASREP